MDHLLDSRAPITADDIDQAISDARWWLDDDATGRRPHVTIDDLIARLLAIVERDYGDGS